MGDGKIENLEVRYEVEPGKNRIGIEFEDKLVEFLKSLGFSCWARGVDLTTGWRDLQFDGPGA